MPPLASTPKVIDLRSKIKGLPRRDARQKLTGSSLPDLSSVSLSSTGSPSRRSSVTVAPAVTSASSDAESGKGTAGVKEGSGTAASTPTPSPAPVPEPGAYPYAMAPVLPSPNASQTPAPSLKRKRPRSAKQKAKARDNAYARRKLKRQQEAQERDRLAALSTPVSHNLIVDVISANVETPKATPSTFAARDVRLLDTASPVQALGSAPVAPTKRAISRPVFGQPRAPPRPPTNPQPQASKARGRGRGGLRSGTRPAQIEGERAANEFKAANPGRAEAVRAAWEAKRQQNSRPATAAVRQVHSAPRSSPSASSISRPAPPPTRLPHGAIRANYTRGPRASRAPHNSATRSPAPLPDIAGMPPLVPIEAPPTPQASAVASSSLSPSAMVSLLGNWMDEQRRRRETEDANLEKIS